MSKFPTRITILGVASIAALVAVVSIASAAPGGGNGQGNRPAGAAQQQGQKRPAPAPPFVAPAAKYLGMKSAALMKQLKAKKTLTAIATAKGKSVDGLKAAILEDAKAKTAADVAAGRIDQDEADERIADLESRINDIVTKPLPARGPGGNCPNRPGAGGGAGTTDPTTTTSPDGGYGDTGTTTPANNGTTGGTYL